MEKLIEGFAQFRKVTYPTKERLFKKLASGQAPHTLIITCADSRVVPEYFTSSDPGEIFVVRNVGNIVPPYAQFVGGVSAAIEYAVVVLGVKDIVVCGHSDCGAMKATLKPGSTEGMPAVTSWLQHAQIARHVFEENYDEGDERSKLLALTEENVIAQLDHLRTHPSVAARLASNRLRIHGWVFDIESADIHVYDAENRCFRTIEVEEGTEAADETVVAGNGRATAPRASALQAPIRKGDAR
ncbi:carbonic anhydrase [Nevskia sp.]|uniref:carbonic anhydrase n=1 Tax=Nevskia sp. TaxID=1929292 RepID=UPI0025F5EE90|nr:carbonic anhydrase [Nevskia sp.]HET7798149.1 carbonic anhydrase [Nevskia sp.]